MSAYNNFAKERLSDLCVSHPELPGSARMKMIAQEWRKMSVKQKNIYEPSKPSLRPDPLKTNSSAAVLRDAFMPPSTPSPPPKPPGKQPFRRTHRHRSNLRSKSRPPPIKQGIKPVIRKTKPTRSTLKPPKTKSASTQYSPRFISPVTMPQEVTPSAPPLNANLDGLILGLLDASEISEVKAVYQQLIDNDIDTNLYKGLLLEITRELHNKFPDTWSTVAPLVGSVLLKYT